MNKFDGFTDSEVIQYFENTVKEYEDLKSTLTDDQSQKAVDDLIYCAKLILNQVKQKLLNRRDI